MSVFLELLDGTPIVRLVEQISHVLLCLVCLLQFVQQHGFLLLQQLGLLLGHIGVVFLELDAIFVAALQCLLVGDYLVDEVGLCADLVVLDALELHLLVLEVKNAVLGDHLVDLVLLGLNLVVGVLVHLEGALHILHDPGLRVKPVLGELLAIALLSLQPLPLHFLLGPKSSGLLFVHLRHKVLSSLELLDALIRSLLFHSQLNNPVFKLQFLVFLLLGSDNCVHHYVLRLLVRHTTHP